MERIVETRSGRVRGGAGRHGTIAFLGVPFAAPASGQRRFAPPGEVAPWDGVRDALAPGPVSMQVRGAGVLHEIFDSDGADDEDCLGLNVWTPDCDSPGLPVLVWIHGGAFAFGAGSDDLYDGGAFARDGVVTVTLNYRLGALGYHHVGDGEPGTGAFGLLDQVAALRWVRDNISAFGGDPARVTVAGQSAGAMSVGALLACPQAAGLFRGAIAQSGAASMTIAATDAALVAEALASQVGLEQHDLDAWRSIPAADLLVAQAALNDEIIATRDTTRFGSAALSRIPWQPMHDGDVLPLPPLEAIRRGASADVALLLGTCRDEFMLMLGAPETPPPGLSDEGAVGQVFRATFGEQAETAMRHYRSQRPGAPPLELAAALEGDRMFGLPAAQLTSARRSAPGATYTYRFSWKSTAFGGRIGAGHAVDVPFVFDALDSPTARRLTGTAAPQQLADEMHGAWVAFARDADPGWACHTDDQRLMRDFGGAVDVIDDTSGDTLELWSDAN